MKYIKEGTKFEDVKYAIKSLRKETSEIAMEIYQKKLKEYEKEKTEWEAEHRLKI